jgi:hypothetical protein
MRKLTCFTGAMLVVALALISGLSTPEPAWAFCYCETYSGLNTDINWGTGSTCSAAHTNLLAQNLQEAAADYCGTATKTCMGTLHIVTPCHFQNGSYMEDGWQEFACKVCI